MAVPSLPLVSVRPRVSPTTLEFWWAPPASPNGTIINYILSCSAPSITHTYDGTISHVLVTGLTAGTDYTFTLVAVNADGNSDPATFRTVRTSSRPIPVATLTKTQTITNGALSATFSWTNPGGGDYAYYYVIGLHAAAGTKDYIYRGTRNYTTLSYTIGGLDPTQSYTFHVQRGNDAGYSAMTNITTAKGVSFDPRSITGLQAWYDAADTAGDASTVSDGTEVATWVDKSGNARNATAAGGSATLQTDANGRRLNLNGTTNRYNLPSGSWSQGQPFTVFSADSSTAEAGSTLIGGANTTGTVDGFSTKYVEGNGIWLIGTGGIAYSLDGGFSWKKSASAAAMFLLGVSKLAWNGSIFVAVGASYIPGVYGSNCHTIAYSYDGINWLQSYSGLNAWGAGGNYGNNSIATNGSLWLAAGYGFSHTIVRSMDGINWQTDISGSAIFNQSAKFAYNPNTSMWVAMNGGSMYYSYNASTWTPSPSGSILGLGYSGGNLTFHGTTWVAVNAVTAYSFDGINWTVSNSANTVWNATNLYQGPVSIATNGSMWVGTGVQYGGASFSIGYSYDGINWQPAETTQPIFNTGSYGQNRALDVAWNGSYWIAIGGQFNNSTMAISYDGIKWTELVSHSDYYINSGTNAIFFAPTNGYNVSATATKKIWVAGGDSGASYNSITYSFDGVNWLASPSNKNQGANSFILFSGGVQVIGTDGKGFWVAGGSSGNGGNRLAYSTDGIFWTVSTSGNALFTSYCTGVAYNGSNLWVAGGQGTNQLAYSTDGINWTASTSGNALFTSICTGVAYNGSNLWVAGGGGTNQLVYSSDGINWTASVSAIFTNYCACVGWNGSNLWVAGGTGTNTLAYSSDGITWTASTSGNSVFTSVCNAVAWNGSMWVAGGTGTNQLAYSTDGINWTASTSGNTVLTNDGRTVAWNGSQWIAGGNGTNYLASSTNGITWTPITSVSQFYSSTINGIAAGVSPVTIQAPVPYTVKAKTKVPAANTSYTTVTRQIAVAGGYTANMAFSYDGINWTFSYSAFAVSDGYCYAIASNGTNVWLAGGNGINRIKYSTDGISWSGSTSGNTVFTTNCYALAYNGSNRWVAGGDGTNQMAYSSDGITWIPDISGNTVFTTACLALAYNGSNKWVAGGEGTNQLGYSSDGINWTASTSGNAIFTTRCYTVVYNGSNKWVAGGTGTNRLAYSSDGETWTASTSGNEVFTNECYAVAYNGTNKWVAGGAGTNTLAYSSDGETWTASASGNAILTSVCYSVAWIGSLWIAGGSGTNTLAYSTDGETWTASPNPAINSSCYAFAYGPSVQTIPVFSPTGQRLIASGQRTDYTTAFLAYSDDGIAWTAFSSWPWATGAICYGFATNGSIWVVAGAANGGLGYSTDGIHWHNALNAAGLNSGNAVATNGSMWVAGSEQGTNIFVYSYDGINWFGLASANALITSACYTVVYNGSNLWVAGGNGTNTLIYSSDGINWTASASGTALFTGFCNIVVYNGTNKWVAGGAGDNILAYSSDGTSWTASTSGNAIFTTACYALAYNGTNKWVAGGAGTNQLAYSTDGETWTASTSGNAIFTTACNSVTWNGTRWVAGGVGTNSLAYSTDGETWTASTSGNALFPGRCDTVVYGFYRDLPTPNTYTSPSQIKTDPVNITSISADVIRTLSLDKQILGVDDASTALVDSNLSIGAVKGTTDFYAGGMREVLIYTGSMADADKAAVTDYLTSKWAAHPLTLVPALPVKHGLTQWLDATDTTTLFQDTAGATPVTSNADPVRLWKDKSGNGADLTGAGALNAKYTASDINTLPGVDCSGALLSSALIPTSSDLTVLIVVKNTVNAADTPFSIWSHQSMTIGGNFPNTYLSGFPLDKTSIKAPYVLSRPTIYAATIGKGQLTTLQKYDLSGTTQFSTVGMAMEGLTLAQIQLGLQSPAATTAGVLSVGEVIYYQRVLTDAEISTMVSYLKLKWGIAAPGVDTLTDNLQLWLDAADPYTVFQDGGTMVAWKNRVNEDNVGLPVGGPTYTAGGGVQFDGATQYFDLPDDVLPTGNTPFSYYAVAKTSSANNGIIGGGSLGVQDGAVALETTDASGIIFAAGNNGGMSYSLDNGTSWASVTIPNDPSPVVHVIAYNGIIWLAGKEYDNDPAQNTLLVSRDGLTWRDLARPAYYATYALAWNGTLWVAGGNCSYGAAGYCLAYSYDGFNWSYSTSGTSIFTTECRCIAWNGLNLFIAVGNGTNQMASSPDGINWTVDTSGNLIFANYCNAVAHNGSNLWVACGQPTNRLAYSTDGLDWSVSSSGNDVFTSACYTVAWNGTIWVAGGSGTNTLAYSSDGMTWAASASGSALFTSYVLSVSWNGTVWVACGEGTNTVATSTDGIDWTASVASGGAFGTSAYSTGSSRILPALGPTARAAPTTQFGTDYALGAGGQIPIKVVTAPPPRIIVAGGVGTNRLGYSYDGMTWTPSVSGNSVFTSDGGDIVSNGSIWVASGTGTNTVAYSVDGVTWYPSPSGNSVLGGGRYATNGTMWVGLAGTVIAYSYDGINWTPSISPFSAYGICVATNGTIWVAGGNGANSTGYSYDGINWTGSASGTALFGNEHKCIATSGTMWVGGGYHPGEDTMGYSYDGVNWTASPSGTSILSGACESVAWNGTIWVAGGYGGGGNVGRIAISTDGINWTNSANASSILSATCYALTWTGSMWVAGGQGTNQFAYSYDGNYWFASRSGNALFTTYCATLSPQFVQRAVTPTAPTLMVGGGEKKVGYSYDGINWITSASGTDLFTTPASGNCRAVAYNGSMWVAGGSGFNRLAYSYDGINWVGSTSGNSIFEGFCNSLAWNGSIWVAGGEATNLLAYSTDGINWTASTSGNAILNAACYGVGWGGNKFVAGGPLGGSNTMAYSYDGINWTASASGTSVFSYGCNAVTWNGSMWVAGGNGETNFIAYSYDGINWTGSTSGNALFTQGLCVAWNGTMWVAGGTGTNTLAYSYDGINWTASTSGNAVFTDKCYSLTWNGSKWVAGGTGTNQLAYSFDGIHWTVSTSGDSVFTTYCTAVSSQVVLPAVTPPAPTLMVGGGYQKVGYSYDAINWANSTSGTALFTGDCEAVAYNGSMWVAGGRGDNRLAYSYDGVKWLASTSGNSIFSSWVAGLAWNGSIWVAVGLGTNHIAYSSNGVNWTASANGNDIFTTYGYAVATNGTTWVAGGQGTNQLAYSTDGINWTASTSGNAIFTTYVFGVAWNGSMWVAGGEGTNQLAYSTDGINWTASTSGNAVFTSAVKKVAWNGSLWVATGDGTNRLAYSTDGINWTGSASGNAAFGGGSGWGLAWNGTMWVAGAYNGTNNLAYSYDGINWTVSSSGSSLFTTYCSALASQCVLPATQVTVPVSNFIVAAGSGGNQLVYSPDDGVTWTVSESGNSVFTSGGPSAYNGSMWVACGDVVGYSTNGVTWTEATSGTDLFTTATYAVATNGAIWVIGGEGTNQLAYSTNGTSWTASASGNAIITTACKSIIWTGTRFIAGGTGGSAYAYSTNGINWTSNTGTGSVAGSCTALAFNGSTIVSAGTGANNTRPMEYSLDGVNWTYSGNSVGSTAASIASNSSISVCIGSSGDLSYSSDGIAWYASPTSTSGSGYSVAWTGNKWLASIVQSSLTKFYSSTDGITWTIITAANGLFTSGVFFGTTYIVPRKLPNITTTQAMPFLLESVYNPSPQTESQYVNSIVTAQDTQALTRTQPSTNNTVGKTLSGKYMKGSIYEILVYKVAHTALQRQIVERYLMAKWFSSNFTPNAANGRPCIWLDSDTLVRSGNNIQAWNDKSGRGANFTPAIAGLYPQYEYDPVTKAYGVAFGSKGYATGISNTALKWLPPNAPGFTLFILGRFNNGAYNNMMYSTNGGTSNKPRLYYSNGLYYVIHGTEAVNSTGYANAIQATLYCENFDYYGGYYPSGTLYVNTIGVLAQANGGAGGGGPDTTLNLGLGYNINTPSAMPSVASGLDGYMFEVVLFPYSMRLAEQQKMEGYLAWKWGQQAALPVNHPYATVAP